MHHKTSFHIDSDFFVEKCNENEVHVEGKSLFLLEREREKNESLKQEFLIEFSFKNKCFSIFKFLHHRHIVKRKIVFYSIYFPSAFFPIYCYCWISFLIVNKTERIGTVGKTKTCCCRIWNASFSLHDSTLNRMRVDGSSYLTTFKLM